MAFPPRAPRTVTNLELYTSDRVLMGSFELLEYSGGEAKFNVAPLKAYQGQVQYFKGDARVINANILCTVRINSISEQGRAISMTVLINWLTFTRIIKIGNVSLRVAGAAGIRSWAPISQGDAKVEIEFIPSFGFFSDDALRFINGEEWEFRLPGNPILAGVGNVSVAGLTPTVINSGDVTESYYAGDASDFAGNAEGNAGRST